MRTGKQAPQLVDVLFGSCRQHILALLLLRPGESFYVREIARLTGVPAGSLHRELKLLTSAGLLERSTVGLAERGKCRMTLGRVSHQLYFGYQRFTDPGASDRSMRSAGLGR